MFIIDGWNCTVLIRALWNLDIRKIFEWASEVILTLVGSSEQVKLCSAWFEIFLWSWNSCSSLFWLVSYQSKWICLAVSSFISINFLLWKMSVNHHMLPNFWISELKYYMSCNLELASLKHSLPQKRLLCGCS